MLVETMCLCGMEVRSLSHTCCPYTQLHSVRAGQDLDYNLVPFSNKYQEDGTLVISENELVEVRLVRSSPSASHAATATAAADTSAGQAAQEGRWQPRAHGHSVGQSTPQQNGALPTGVASPAGRNAWQACTE